MRFPYSHDKDYFDAFYIRFPSLKKLLFFSCLPLISSLLYFKDDIDFLHIDIAINEKLLMDIYNFISANTNLIVIIFSIVVVMLIHKYQTPLNTVSVHLLTGEMKMILETHKKLIICFADLRKLLIDNLNETSNVLDKKNKSIPFFIRQEIESKKLPVSYSYTNNCYIFRNQKTKSRLNYRNEDEDIYHRFKNIDEKVAEINQILSDLNDKGNIYTIFSVGIFDKRFYCLHELLASRKDETKVSDIGLLSKDNISKMTKMCIDRASGLFAQTNDELVKNINEAANDIVSNLLSNSISTIEFVIAINKYIKAFNKTYRLRKNSILNSMDKLRKGD